ncbi:MAG TPA: alpha/beta hydrolase [Acidobacteriota bacterium]|nr:alpha/beta hydrolase [Acidobacteriota bacterium]
MLLTPRLGPCLSLLALIPLLLSASATEPQILRHAFKETPSRPLELICYLPPHWKSADRRPAVVFFFGGGFWTWNVEQFAQQADYFARRGLVTILADYRTGEKDGAKPPMAFEDARSAFRWVRQNADQLGVDPKRIAASGGSAGGLLSAALLIVDGLDAPGEDRNVSVRPDALLLYNPALGTQVNERTIQRFGDESTWRKTAAALHADGTTPPTLLLFGSADSLLNSGKAWAEKLRTLGVRVDVKIAAGVGHGFFNFSPHLAASTRDVDEFLQSLNWLAPEPVVLLPVGEAKLSPSADNPERGQP